MSNNTNKTNSFNKNNRYFELRIFIIIFVLIIIFMSSSYSYLVTVINGNKNTEIIAGTLKVKYEDKNEINLTNTYPMSDTQGMNTESYKFTITNEGNVRGRYEIDLEELTGNTLDKSNIRYSIKEENGSWSEPKSLEYGIVLKNEGILNGGASKTYELKIWLKENAKNEVQGLTYKAKIVVSLVQENAVNSSLANPVIQLNGEKEVVITKGSTYIENGVKSIISTENLDIANVTRRYEYYNGSTTTTVNSIDTSNIGVYYIYYEITNSKGLKGIATRVVNVVRKDATPPVITLSGNSSIVLLYNTNYVEPGYSSIDDQDGNITDKVIVEGTVNKELPGTYTIKYISIDTLGNISSRIREVIVEPEENETNMDTSTEIEGILSSKIDIELRTKAAKAYYSIKTTKQKPSDNEYKEITTKVADEDGYSIFKASEIINKNGVYYVYTKDSNGKVTEKTIVVDNIDDTKPSCEFSNIRYVGYNKNTEVYLTCVDIVDIKNNTVTKDILDVSDDTIADIVSIETAERIGSGSQKGYTYRIVLKGKKVGEFTLGLKKDKIEDSVGNKNDRLEKEAIEVTKIDANNPNVELDLTRNNSHQIEIAGVNEGNLSYVSSDSSVATVSASGVITGIGIGTTTITVTESNGGATTDIEVTVVKTLDVVLEKGNNVEETGATLLSCTSRVASGKCSIKLPSITTSRGYDVDGWYEGTTKVGNPNDNYEITENKRIVGKAKAQKYTIVYDCNGGTKPTSKLENETATYGTATTLSTDRCIKEGYTQVYWEDPTGNRSWTDWSGVWSYINGEYGISNKTLTLKAIYSRNVEIPTTSYCKNLTYNGENQTLVKNSETGFSWTDGVTRKYAGTQEVTAHLAENYIWSDGDKNDKKIICGINKATPSIELSSNAGTQNPGKSTTFTATTKSGTSISIVGVLDIVSTNVTYATVSPISTNVTATTTGVATEATVNALSSNGTNESVTTITIDFTPSDTDNFNSATQKIYTMTINPYTRTATFNPNNNTLSTPSGCEKNSTTGVVTCSCTTTGTSTSCSITAPQITAHSNTTSICGYSDSSAGAKTGCTAHNNSLTISSNPTYHAQTYSDKNATFTIQDSNAATQSGGSTSCTAYNGAASCNISSPALTAKTGYTSKGWKKDGTASSTSADVGNSSTSISISSNAAYKSVTYRTFTATTQKNVSSATGTGTSTSCDVYNGAESCNISLPSNPYSLSNYTFIGWVNAGSNTTSTATSGSTSTMDISGNVNIVAIWRNTNYNTQYTATTKKNVSSATGTDTSVSCNLGATYNGAAVPTSCSVNLPSNPYSLSNYTFIGWVNAGSSTTSTATSGSTTTMNISGNVNIVAIWRNTNYNTQYTATTKKNVSSATGTDTSVSCRLGATYNGAQVPTSCSINLPSNPYSLSNYTFNGWVNAGSNTTSTATSGSTSTMNISGNVNIVATWYRNLSVTFSRNTTEVSNSLSSTSGSCTVYNGGTSCTASANSPTFTANSGYNELGFFESNSGIITPSSSPMLSSSTSYTISTDSTDLANKKVQTGTTLYARGYATEPPSKPTLSIAKSNNYNDGMYLTFGATSDIGIKKYIVYYGTSSTSMTNSKTYNTSSTSTSDHITGLTFGQTYYFKVVAYDLAEQTSTSDIVSKKIDVYRYYTTLISTSETSTHTGTTTTTTIDTSGKRAMEYITIPTYYNNNTITFKMNFTAYSNGTVVTTNNVNTTADIKSYTAYYGLDYGCYTDLWNYNETYTTNYDHSMTAISYKDINYSNTYYTTLGSTLNINTKSGREIISTYHDNDYDRSSFKGKVDMTNIYNPTIGNRSYKRTLYINGTSMTYGILKWLGDAYGCGTSVKRTLIKAVYTTKTFYSTKYTSDKNTSADDRTYYSTSYGLS